MAIGKKVKGRELTMDSTSTIAGWHTEDSASIEFRESLRHAKVHDNVKQQIGAFIRYKIAGSWSLNLSRSPAEHRDER